MTVSIILMGTAPLKTLNEHANNEIHYFCPSYMKKLLLILVPLMLISCLGKNKMQAKVLEQADEFGNFLKRKQYDKHIAKMAYFVYANEEEKEQLKENLKANDKYNEQRDSDLTKVTSLLNSEIYENNGYYQCIVKQVRSYTNNFTTVNSNFYLLAISKNGEDWKFADITGLNIEIVRAVFKEMHPDLTVALDESDKVTP